MKTVATALFAFAWEIMTRGWSAPTNILRRTVSNSFMPHRVRSSHSHLRETEFSQIPDGKSLEKLGGPLAASRLGLDPSSNRFHAPIVYHEDYSFADWPSLHTFPMDKFARTAHALLTTCKATYPESSLPRPLVRQELDFFRPLDFGDVPRSWLSGPIDSVFVDRFLNAQLSHEECRVIGFREQTGRTELIRRTVLEVAGTVLTSQLACRYGIAAHVAGGTHHAHVTGGAGYTIFNDLAVATHVVTATEPSVERVLVIDCDVHQGDGTARFSAAPDGPLHSKLYTLSLHCASNYPRLKAHSTWDVGLPDRMEDDEYMDALVRAVDVALAAAQPDLVLYDAGVDVYRKDKLGRLHLTLDGIRRRDRWVLDRCVSAGMPVAAVVGGGYDRDVDALARRHAIVHEEASYVWRKHRMWERAASLVLTEND
jgi:acetoin utilization deacetylase AcuC-like enzyme